MTMMMNTTTTTLLVPRCAITKPRHTLKPTRHRRTRLKLRKAQANVASVCNKKRWTGRMLDDRNILMPRHLCSAMKSTCTLLRRRIPANL